MTRDRLLRRAQLGSLILGAVACGVLLSQGKLQVAKGLAVGTIWATLSLRCTEGLLRAMLVPRDQERNQLMVAIWFLLKMSVYVLAVWLLIVAPFPVVGMAHGLTVMLIALVIAGCLPQRQPGETTRSAPQSNVSRRGDDAHA